MSKTKKKMGRPEVEPKKKKKTKSVRINDATLELIMKKHNSSLQSWFDKCVQMEIVEHKKQLRAARKKKDDGTTELD